MIYAYADFIHQTVYSLASARSCSPSAPDREAERWLLCGPQTDPHLCSAGFGKTTLVGEWVADASGANQRFGWPGCR